MSCTKLAQVMATRRMPIRPGCNEIVNVLNGAAEVLRGFLARKSKTGKFCSVGHSCHRALVARLRGATEFAVDCGFVNPPQSLHGVTRARCAP